MSSANNDNFTSSLPIWIPFPFFKLLDCCDQDFQFTVLNRSGENGCPCLVSEFSWKAFIFFIPEYYVGFGFVINSHFFVEIRFLYTHFGENFQRYLLFDCVGSQLQHVGSLLHHAGSFVAVHRLSSCGVWAQLLLCIWESQFPKQGLTFVPYLARQIHNHWTTRKVPDESFYREWMANFIRCFFCIY